MRVLLVEPPICRHDVGTGVIGMAEPLSLECVAAALAHHEVRILDMRLDRDLDRALRTFKPHTVGVGAYTVGVNNAKAVLQQAKRHDARIRTIVGGHHATVKPRDFSESYVDAVVVGEGELTFPELLEAFEGAKDLRGIQGLGLPEGGGIVLTPERPLSDLDTLPFPARHLVSQYRQSYFRGKWRPIVSMFTSRGCPHRCSFCGMWKVHRGKYRLRSPERVVEELKQIPEEYVDVVDDNTFENVAWARRLAALIGEAGIRKRYKVYARSDTLAKHPEVIRDWKAIGLDTVLVGIESVGQGNLGKWNKRSSVELNEAALKALKEQDVEIASYFVVDPDFAEKDFAELKAYIDRWELHHPAFTILTPFPGTDLFDSVQDRIRHPDYELFDFFHVVLPTRLAEPVFYERFVDLYKYAYSFSRAARHLKKQRFFGVSLRQLLLRRRFFAQLDGLVKAHSG